VVGAQFRLATLYAEGRGIPQDDAAAARWYRAAAEQGHAEAQYVLGRLCQEGHGVPQSDADAVHWWLRAAAQEFPPAIGIITRLRNARRRDRCTTMRPSEVAEAESMFRRAVLYARGEGVTRDEQKSFRYFHKAAELGHIQAQYEVGSMYLEGRGVTRHRDRARRWFQKAADQGCKRSATAIRSLIAGERE
jgi:TPR repeat protein